MLNEILEILQQEDDTFTFYQFPVYLFSRFGEVAHTIVEEHTGEDYMGLREAWKLIDKEDLNCKYVAEIGCNMGATSWSLLNSYATALWSYDPSPKAIDICCEVRKYHMMLQWDIKCMKFEEETEGLYYQTIIWEDPHSASDEEWQKILDCIYRIGKTIYFLECDNIYHLIKDKNLEQLSENSWRLVQ